MGDWRVIQGCPAHKDIAPYIAIVVNDAHARVDSIFRGQSAAWILHRHGKHSQAELYRISVDGTPAQREAAGLPPGGGGVNRPGRSTHELLSDGIAYPVAAGRALAWWQQGFDVHIDDVGRCLAAARRHGWKLFQPYHVGSELHHLNFQFQPKRPTPGTLLWGRLWRLRLTLPKS